MRRIYLVILFCFSFLAVYSMDSPFNSKKIEIDSSNNYSFIVSGHFYGGSTNSTGYPANTLLANLDWINDSDNNFLICLGDLFKDVQNDIPKYQSSLFDELNLPLYNAVGNHDLSGNIFQENFGETSYYFQAGNDIHLILDSEQDDGDISGNQLELLKKAIEVAKGLDEANLFIYAHRTLWKEAYPEMESVFNDNTQSLTANNFEDEIKPLLEKAAEQMNVYWFAGSLGNAPASFFYHHDEKSKLTFIATAIRALPRDAVLEVSVNEGDVSFNTHSLTGQELEPVESYNLDFWNETSAEEPFNWRLVPLYFKNTLLHRYFWYGVLWTTFGFLFILLFKKWRAKRKAA
jgi:Calcineurin-like phosphoesterase